MKFKVGDRVRLVRMEDENREKYKKYLGQEFEIEWIHNGVKPHCELKGNDEIAPYLKNLELVKEFTYEDLKKSPIGTRVTFENGKVFIRTCESLFENEFGTFSIEGIANLKNKNCGKIIKIEEPTYKKVYEAKVEILDETEKRYLREVVRPFRDKLEHIIKKRKYNDIEEFIGIKIKNEYYIVFPHFKKNTMYKGMKVDKKYTLKELGL